MYKETKEKSKMSEELQAKAVGHVNRKYTELLQLNYTIRARMLEMYRVTRIFQVRRDSPWKSRVFVPKAYETLVTLAPYLVANVPTVDLLPVGKEDEPFAKDMSDFINWQLEAANLDGIMEPWGIGAFLYGSYHLKVTWQTTTKYKSEKKTLKKNEDGSEWVEETEKELIDKDIPKLELIDPFNFLADPRVPNLDDQDCIMQITEAASLDELKKHSDIYFNLDKIKSRQPVKDTYLGTDMDKMARQAMMGVANVTGNNAEQTESQKIELIEFQGKFKPDAEPEDYYIITVANNSTVIRFEKLRDCYNHGKYTYIKLDDQPWPGEYYGISTVEPLVGLQAQMIDIVNQRLDNLKLILNRMWILNVQSNLSPGQVKSVPGAVMPVQGDPNQALIPVQTQDVTGNAYNETDYIDRLIQTVSGVTDFGKGVGSSGLNDTATGVSIVSEAAKSRSEAKLKRIRNAIAWLVKMFLSLNGQFITEKQWVRILGPGKKYDWKEIKKEAFKGSYDVRVKGNMRATSPQQRQDEATALMNFFQPLMEGFKAPKMDGTGEATYMPNMMKVGELVIKAFREMDEISDYFFETEPVPEPVPEAPIQPAMQPEMPMSPPMPPEQQMPPQAPQENADLEAIMALIQQFKATQDPAIMAQIQQMVAENPELAQLLQGGAAPQEQPGLMSRMGTGIKNFFNPQA